MTVPCITCGGGQQHAATWPGLVTVVYVFCANMADVCGNLPRPENSCVICSMAVMCRSLPRPEDSCVIYSMAVMCRSLPRPEDSCVCCMLSKVAVCNSLAWSGDSYVCYLQSMTAMCSDLPRPFEKEVRERLQKNGPRSDTTTFNSFYVDLGGFAAQKLHSGIHDQILPVRK